MLRFVIAAMAAASVGACASNTALEQYDVDANATIERVGDDWDYDTLTPEISEFLGASAENVAIVLSRLGADFGEPDAFIAGGEASGAAGPGLRYGRGTMVTRSGQRIRVYWQGPSIGFDVGGNASRTFTLVYNLDDANDVFRRFPGVEGSAYLVGGVGVNYQRAEDITLAPIRAGAGLRLGANVGYLAYSRDRNILPF